MALYSNTLAVIRQYLSSAVGDLLYGQCGTTSATSQVTHAPFLWQPNNYYLNHNYEVYVYEGPNIGETRRVSDWVLSGNLLTVHAVYDTACTDDSYIELHYIFTEDELRKAINLSIESLAGKYLIDIKDESTIKLTSTEDNLGNTVYTYEYALPLSMLYLYRVIPEHGVDGIKLTGTVNGAFTEGETADGGTSGASGEVSYGPANGYIRVRKVSGTFVVGETATGDESGKTCIITAVESETAGTGKFEASDELDHRDYSIIKAYAPKLKLHEDRVTIDEDLYLRLEGQGTQPIVDDDADIIYLPPDWLVQKAITMLPQNKIQSNKLDETYRRALVISAKEPRTWPDPRSQSVVE